MKLLTILFENLLKSSLEFQQAVNKIKDQGGKLIGTGDFGNVYKIGDKVVKVTTDETELEHAEILKNRSTRNFVQIEKVEVIKDSLGVITMEDLHPLDPSQEISSEFLEDLQKEAQDLGIDPDELDMWGSSMSIKRDNFMKDPRTGQIKMVDV